MQSTRYQGILREPSVNSCILINSEKVHPQPTVEEHSCRFCTALSQPSWPSAFEFELPLRDRLPLDDMSRVMLLDSICCTQFDVSTPSIHSIDTV